MYPNLSFELLLLLLTTFTSSRVLERSPEPIDGLLIRGVEERDVCVQDDWLIGFKAMQADSYPFCSSLLGIGTLTGTSTVETVGLTAYTAVTTTTTDGTVRVASVTSTATITVNAVPVKRDAFPEPEANPAPMVALPQQMMLFQAATSAMDNGGTNSTIINTIYSACSCLHPRPRAATAPATATTTRIQTVIYRSEATQTNFDGETTTTVYTTNRHLPSPSVTSPPYHTGPSGGILPPSGGNLSSSAPLTTPTPYSIPSTGPSGLLTSEGNGTLPSLTTPASETSFSPSSPRLASSGLPLPSANGTSPTSLSSSTASPIPLPSGPPLAGVCPEQDGEIITEVDGEQFQILCYTNFPNMPTAGLPTGLDVPTFRACVQECQIANDGFSAYRCRGVTYIEGLQGINCFFKNAAAVLNPEYDIYNGDVSAILLNPNNTFPVPSLPATSSPGPSIGTSLGGYGNSTGLPGPTAYPVPSLNHTSVSTTAEVPSTASGLPSFSGNFTPSTGPTGYPSSGLPTISANETSIIEPTTSVPFGSPTFSGNSTPSALPTGSVSGFSVASSNQTSIAAPATPAPSAPSAPSGSPIISGNFTPSAGLSASMHSGFPSLSGNFTPSAGPTGSASSGLPSISANGTSALGPTASAPSGIPSFSGNFTPSAGPTGPTPSGFPSISGNFTPSTGLAVTAPSLAPSNSANITASPSLTPTNSLNITSVPSLFPTFSGNGTSILPTGTGVYNSSSSVDPRSGGPRPTSNSTCLYVASRTIVTTQTVRSTQIFSVTRTAIVTITSPI